MAKVLTDQDFDESIKEGITLVDFYADWCSPCKLVAPVIEELAEETVEYNVFKLDVEASPEISARYSVRSIPTFIVFKDGEEIVRASGANQSKEYYLNLIAQAEK